MPKSTPENGCQITEDNVTILENYPDDLVGTRIQCPRTDQFGMRISCGSSEKGCMETVERRNGRTDAQLKSAVAQTTRRFCPLVKEK